MIELNEIQGKIETTLLAIERGYTATPYISVVCGAYVLSLAAEHVGVTDLNELLEVGGVSKTLSRFIRERLHEHWDKYRPILTAFPIEALRDYLKSTISGERFELSKISGSSLPVADLVCDILNIGDGETIADIGCGAGDLLRNAECGIRNAELVGYEINEELAAIAEISLTFRLPPSAFRINRGDCFNSKYEGDRFDKVFSQPPFGVRGLPERENVRGFIEKAFPDFPTIPASAGSDWLYAARAVAAMKQGGRAVVILPPSAMLSQQAEPFRRYFVQRNLVEAVIELPPRLFSNTSISTCMVVFSEGNESVKMIRADNLFEKGRSNNALTKDGVAKIVKAMQKAECGMRKAEGKYERRNDLSPHSALRIPHSALSEICAVVAKADLLEEMCNLTVLQHFADPMALKESVPFGAVIKCAKRGASITSKELDEIVCEDDTLIDYIAPGNINDGVIDAELPHLKFVPERYSPFCVSDGDVIITRVMANGSAFKVAVVELAEGHTLLPGGNILAVTVDPEKADPYFIKSCLENEYAQRYLRNSAVGNMVKTLHYKSLEMLPIPVMPIERQREIGEKCRAAVRRVRELRNRLGEARAALGSILADNAADCFRNAE